MIVEWICKLSRYPLSSSQPEFLSPQGRRRVPTTLSQHPQPLTSPPPSKSISLRFFARAEVAIPVRCTPRGLPAPPLLTTGPALKLYDIPIYSPSLRPSPKLRRHRFPPCTIDYQPSPHEDDHPHPFPSPVLIDISPPLLPHLTPTSSTTSRMSDVR